MKKWMFCELVRLMSECWIRLRAFPKLLQVCLFHYSRSDETKGSMTVSAGAWRRAFGEVLLLGVLGSRLKGPRVNRRISSFLSFSGKAVSICNGPFLHLPSTPNAESVIINDIREIFFEEAYAMDDICPGPGDTVIDCGANIGLFPVWALERTGREGRFVCLEPNEGLAGILRRNLEAFDLGNQCEIVKSALSDKRGKSDFLFSNSCFTAAHMVNAKEARWAGQACDDGQFLEEVDVCTLDDVVDSLGLDHVDFIKMDVEGHEIPALKGAAGTLRRFAPKLAISAYHRPLDVVDIPRLILQIQPRYRALCVATSSLMCFAEAERS